MQALSTNADEFIIPDLLAPGLRLVFCGMALSRVSAAKGAYYANPGNEFWKVLHRVGISERKFAPEEYAELLALNIGLTDICKTAIGNDDELPKQALDVEGFRQKILHYTPKLVAFTSKNTAQTVLGRKVAYGMQEETIGNTKLYVCCSTSGRARRFWQEAVWEELASWFKGLE